MVNAKRIDFGQLRTVALGLSKRQMKLRQRARAYVTETGVSPSALASSAEVRRQSLIKFLEGEQSLIETGTLGVILGVEVLCKEITELSEKLPDRYMGLVNFDKDVIVIVFDLLDAFASQPIECTMAEFAAAFSHHESIVRGALLCTKDDLIKLRDQPAIIQELLNQLLDEQFEERLKEAKAAADHVRQTRIEEIERLVAILRPRFADKVSLVQEMGFAKGSLDRASLLRASEGKLGEFIATLERAINADNAISASKPPKSAPSTASSLHTEEADPFRGLAGDSQSETPYVLTAADFKKISDMPLEALLDSFKTSSRITRGLLALLAQVKGDDARALMQQPAVQREIEELYLALELVSVTHPTALLELFEKQRQQWGSMRRSNASKKEVL